MIKACFIIKYPPIQGGVSRHGYWLARDLAERGHQIFVVTNAAEVEDEYRIYMDEDDRDWYEPRFEDSGGFIKVRNSQPVNKNLIHIPFTNPFVTKLASIATQVIRRHNCQIIFSYYLQPYGLAAYLASQWTGVPYVVRHAGSDLGRLMRQRDLTTAYREVMKAAACVWTGLNDSNSFLAMGVREERIWRGQANSLARIFNPQTPPLDLNELLKKLATVESEHVQGVLTNTASLDLSKPTIGIYGKVGEVKGSFDLLSALRRLKQEGLDFNFVALTQGRDFPSFKAAIREHGLQERTWTFPFIPNWRVPGFIRACAAVCFLERDFPISFHGPGIPKEILACGTCLILSNEIAAKQRPLGDKFNHGENVLIVADPKEHDELARNLRFVIQHPDQASAIGLNGRSLLERKAASPRKPRERIVVLEEKLEEIIEAHQAEANRSITETTPAPDRKQHLKSRLPHTSALLNGNWERLVEAYCGQPSETLNQFGDAVRFCEFLEGQLAHLTDVSCYLENMLRYEKQCNFLYADFRGASVFASESEAPTLFGPRAGRAPAGIKSMSTRPRGTDELLRHKPFKARGLSVETFDYDVEEVADCLERGEEVGVLPADKKFILFKKEPNFIGVRLELSEATKYLLDYCDGRHTVREIIALVMQHLPGGLDGKGDDEVKREVITTLRTLSAKGVILWLDD